MKDTELYRQILGIEAPWFVENIDLDVPGQKVEVFVKHKRGLKWPCPKCGALLACHDHAAERTWRHLDTCQYRTFLKAQIPRVECPEHGVLQVKVPWSEARSRFTLLMERFALDVIHHAQNVTAACKILNLSWDEAWGIMKRAVERGQRRKKHNKSLRKICVDEKSFKGGHKSYVTVVSDLERSSRSLLEKIPECL